MKKYLVLLCLMLTGTADVSAYLPELPSRGAIITRGVFYYQPGELERIEKRIGAVKFYGLYRENDLAVIKPVGKLKIEPGNIKRKVHIKMPDHITVHHDFIRNEETGVTFMYVEMRAEDQPVLFLSLPGYDIVSEQPLIAKENIVLPENGDFEFEYNGMEYKLIHTMKSHLPARPPSDISITLVNTTTGERQLLSYRDDMRSTRSYVMFIGDIDGDGSLDFILNESPRGHHGHYVLYLSSAAAKGQMVGKVVSEYNSSDPPYKSIWPEYP